MRRRRLALTALLGALGAVCFAAHYPVQKPIDAGDGGPRTYYGIVTTLRPGLLNARMLAECSTDGMDASAVVMLYLHSVVPVVGEGDAVEFTGVPEMIEPPLMMRDLSPMAFAYERGAVQVFHLREDDIRVVREASGLKVWLERQRQAFASAVLTCGLGERAAVFVTAVLTGDSDVVSDCQRELFARAGVAHVLALSGTHIAVLALLCSAMFFPLMLAGSRRMAALGSVGLLWGYALLTGGSPPVVRAVVMATAVAVGRMSGRYYNGFNSLCGAGLVLAVWDPLILFDAGFQLSFSAVAAIVLFIPFVPRHREKGVRRLMQGVLTGCATCIAAVAGTAPLAVFRFHAFPVMFLLANAVVSPLLPVLMFGGLGAAAFHAAGWDAAWLCRAIDWVYGIVEGVCGWIGSLPGAVVADAGVPVWFMIPYYGALAGIWMALSRRRWVFAAGAGLLMVFAAGCRWVVLPSDRGSEAFSPANHYCTAVIAREGRRCLLLTDAEGALRGRLREQYEFRFSQYMTEHGVDSLELTATVTDGVCVFADRRCWAIGEHVIALATGEAMPVALAVKPDMLLVTRSFKGDIVEAFRASGAGMVVLSPAVYDYRRRRFEKALKEAGIPFCDRLPRRLM